LVDIVTERLPRPPLPQIRFHVLAMLRNAICGAELHKIGSGDFVRVRNHHFFIIICSVYPARSPRVGCVIPDFCNQFQLVPIGDKCCPRWFKTREFPPEAEVRERRYLYEPVPMEDVELTDIPLSHLLKPGPHTDKFWITTFPKKLQGTLIRQPGPQGQQVIGWGVRVNEELDFTFVLASMLIMLVVIGVSVVVMLQQHRTSLRHSVLGLF
jgi:hypothetical protein